LKNNTKKVKQIKEMIEKFSLIESEKPTTEQQVKIDSLKEVQ